MRSRKSRARDLGIPFDGTPGTANAITDVSGVQVGHSPSAPKLLTGVTAILPLPNDTTTVNVNYPNGLADPDNPGIDTFVLAAWFTINGCGEMTGTTWIEESGFLEGPIMLTNTVGVGAVRDAVIAYSVSQQPKPIDPDTYSLYLPVVAETYDGWLNDILNVPITQDMVWKAINNATTYADPSQVQEGNVGSGTGMTCYSWKGGIGTASRCVLVYKNSDNVTVIPNPNNDPKNPHFTVGVLVQANQGNYWDLVIRGVPMGQDPQFAPPPKSPDTPPGKPLPKRKARKSSIIVVIATDAPLLPNQLKRLARRATHGIARTGTITDNDSGELFIAFTTANLDAADDDTIAQAGLIPNDSMDPLFEATVQATEEAILNALCAAKTIAGYNQNHVAYAITDPPAAANPPTLSLVDMLKKYNRYKP